MNRIEAITLVDRMIKQAIVISHHVGEGGPIIEHYIKEKLDMCPALDKRHKSIRDKIANLLLEEHGVDLEEARHGRY